MVIKNGKKLDFSRKILYPDFNTGGFSVLNFRHPSAF